MATVGAQQIIVGHIANQAMAPVRRKLRLIILQTTRADRKFNNAAFF